MSDKLVIANRSALLAKYDDAGWQAIEAALGGMIGRDAASGLQTEIIYIDDQDSMATVNGVPVESAADEAGAKAAVDSAYAARTPDYIVLLGGPDVVPHIDMDALPGMEEDEDESIPSDLPYACDAPFSRDVRDFIAVTRVVGRLPAPRGSSRADLLVAVLDAAGGTGGTGGDYTDPFALSSADWRLSTEINLGKIFGSGHSLSVSPPDSHPGINALLGKLIHLINCHGFQASEEFTGENEVASMTSMSSGSAGPHIQAGTVVAAECCYGAELYDPEIAGVAQPICVEYLERGAHAFMGSTNTSYGGATELAEADFMVQYFLLAVLAGASTGRAMLEARQKFVTSQTMSNVVSLKSLAQFLLLGDPSLHPVSSYAGGSGSAEQGGAVMDVRMGAQPAVARTLRRMALRGAGIARSLAVTLPGERVEPSPELASRLAAIAQEAGIAGARISVFSVRGGKVYEFASKLFDVDRKVATIVARGERRGKPFVEALVAHISGDLIGRVERAVSR